MSDMDWTGALCAESDPELWFSSLPTEPAIATQLCIVCPLRQPCVEYARSLFDGVDVQHRHGIWSAVSFSRKARAAA